MISLGLLLVHFEKILLLICFQILGFGDHHAPHFMIFTDQSTKSIVLAIRGTSSAKDAIVDAVATDIEFLDGYAHCGMARSSQRILAESGQIIKKAFETYSGYRFDP